MRCSRSTRRSFSPSWNESPGAIMQRDPCAAPCGPPAAFNAAPGGVDHNDARQARIGPRGRERGRGLGRGRVMSDVIHRNSLTQLAAGLRAKQFSSVELVRAYLARIEAGQTTLNAFISVTADQALAAAAAATEKGV